MKRKILSGILILIFSAMLTVTSFAANLSLTPTASAPVTNGSVTNIAAGKRVVATRIALSDGTRHCFNDNSYDTAIQKLTDGNKANGAFKPLQNDNITAYNYEYVIDFDAKQTFNNITFYDNRGGGFNGYEIEVSDDNKSWTPVQSGSIKWQERGGLGAKQHPVLTSVTFPSQSARYFKITLTNPMTVKIDNNTGAYVSGSLGTRPYAPQEIELYNLPRYLTADNLANANIYTDVKAYASSSDKFFNYRSKGVVTPNTLVANQADYYSVYTNTTKSSERWAAIDLGQERSFDKVQIIPKYANIDKYSLYSLTEEQFKAVEDLCTANQSESKADNLVDVSEIGKTLIYESPSGLADKNCTINQVVNDVTTDNYDSDRKYSISGTFENTTARYVLLMVDSLVGADVYMPKRCYIRSIELYNGSTASLADDNKIEGDAASFSATLRNINAKNGSQVKKVIAAEYLNNQLLNAEIVDVNVPADAEVKISGSYTADNEDASVMLFVWNENSIVPFTEAKKLK